MGLTNAPAIFQNVMQNILKHQIESGFCMVYLDDVIVFSKTVEDHARHLDAILTQFKQHNLFCQLPKCVWAKQEIKYLGHIVSGQGIKPDPAKIAVLDSWEPPLTQVKQLEDASISSAECGILRKEITHEVRRYLGFMNYFHRFIPRFSELAMPLYEQTKDPPPAWDTECTQAWAALKSALRKYSMVYHPQFSEPFHVYADASIRAIGGALMQMDNQSAAMVPVAFCARKLSSAEINYFTTEQEMLAMVFCFQQWRCYLEGSRVILHTDHEPLTWLATQPSPNRRQARWLEFLSRFDYEVVYVKGDQNIVADALSRRLTLPDAEAGSLPCEEWPSGVAVCRQYGAYIAAYLRSSCAAPGSSPAPARPNYAESAVPVPATGSGHSQV